jgi:hypothetical protein
MSNAATQAKQRWNAAKNFSSFYTQVKVSVNPEVASAFKSAYAAANVSMAEKLTQLMTEFSDTVAKDKTKPNYSTKRQRRASVRSIARQLEQIKDAEECYKDNIPANLQGSVVFEAADQSVSLLDEAIETLDSVY